jgi:Fur family ferric uptake transcriptional regulator
MSVELVDGAHAVLIGLHAQALEASVASREAEVIGVEHRCVGIEQPASKHCHDALSHADRLFAEFGSSHALSRVLHCKVMPSDAELSTRLHQRGLRMTPQRQQVLDAVRALEHATPEQVSVAVPDVDLTTVYRTLELLEELDLLRHTHLGHGAASFRLAEDDHVHVVCHSCGKVIDVPDDLIDPLAERLMRERDFTVDRSHFTVFGRCSDCAATESEQKHPSTRSH